jgi:hypothetical protein
VGELLLSLPVCGFAGLIIFVARLWFRGAHPSVVSRGPITTICLSVGSRGSPVCGFAGCYSLLFCLSVGSRGSLVCGFAGCYSYYMPVCGFAGLTCLWICGVLYLLFACLWVRGAHLSAVSRGAILYYLPVCGFAGHFVLSFLVIEFPP